MASIRILVADDHALVRAGIRSLLQSFAGVEVIAEAGDGREALKQVADQLPDIVLMDITMKGLNGLEATARVAREFPKVRVVILSVHADEEFVRQALQVGAAGYILKNAAPEELERAVLTVARGEIYLCPIVAGHVVSDYRRLASGKKPSGSLAQLTPRQREVLQLIAEGRTNRKIAEILHVSPNTIITHRIQLMERLDIHDVVGLVRLAIREGLVAPET